MLGAEGMSCEELLPLVLTQANTIEELTQRAAEFVELVLSVVVGCAWVKKETVMACDVLSA